MKVEDRGTLDLMVEFYRRLWIEGESKAEALWHAKETLRGRRDGEGRPLYTTRGWAGWVLSGEPD